MVEKKMKLYLLLLLTIFLIPIVNAESFMTTRGGVQDTGTFMVIQTFNGGQGSPPPPIQVPGVSRFFIENSEGTEILNVSSQGVIQIYSLIGAYSNGEAYLCVYNNGTLFAKDTACN